MTRRGKGEFGATDFLRFADSCISRKRRIFHGWTKVVHRDDRLRFQVVERGSSFHSRKSYIRCIAGEKVGEIKPPFPPSTSPLKDGREERKGGGSQVKRGGYDKIEGDRGAASST